MNKTTKKDLKKYYREIQQELTCSFLIKKILIKELKNNIKNSEQDNPELTINDIIEIYGTPKEIANGLHEENYANMKKKKNKMIIIIILLSILVIACIFLIIFIINNLGGTIVVTGPSK